MNLTTSLMQFVFCQNQDILLSYYIVYNYILYNYIQYNMNLVSQKFCDFEKTKSKVVR